ncbi:hypothetical protein EsHS_00001360 [Epichloe bromicola]
MFRRLWPGLPKDAEFPSDLEGLGYVTVRFDNFLDAYLTLIRYFVHENDEIRSIENPDNYFKFFINRNPRVNQRQRFEFNAALAEIIHQRLEDEGLEKIRLPLGAGPRDPHVPIFASPDLASKTRIVVVFGEPTQHLGLLAGRVANGPGGINKGSMVSVVQELHSHISSVGDPSPPGIIIANPGQLYWWPEGFRTLTITDSAAIPLPSLVHTGRRYCEDLNSVPSNRTSEEHVSYVVDELLGEHVSESAKLSLVAIGQSCEVLTKFLDNARNSKRWLERVDAMLLLGTVYPTDTLQNDLFKDYLAEVSFSNGDYLSPSTDITWQRSRAYILSPEPINTPLAPPAGNLDECIPALGSPCYSSAEPFYTEMILVTALKPALQYLQDVATSPGYKNDGIVVADRPQREFNDEDWERLPDGEKPSVGVVNEDAMKAQLKNTRRWRKIVKTGEIPDTDSSDEEEE